MKIHLLPEKGKFYKANLHCHTNVSDGKVYINTSECERITLSCSTRKNRNVYRVSDTLTQGEFDIRPEDKYIRFTVADKYGKTASTNAYFLDDFLR